LRKVGYAIARTKGLNLVSETASSLTGQAVLEAVEQGGLGETNVNQQFSSEVAGNITSNGVLLFEGLLRPPI